MYLPKITRIVTLALLAGVAVQVANAQASEQYETDQDILYRAGDALTDYEQERCRLDVYHPTRRKNFPTVVWFHGGGLRSGNRAVPEALKEKGFAIVAANYRLSPQVKVVQCIEDAAAAVAWTFGHIETYGGDKSQIFVAGMSAGGYLTNMLGLDKRWLAAQDIDADSIAGLISYSGHAITHFTARAERDMPGTQPLIDDMAPLYHVRKDAPPLLLITGDRDLEMLGRYEEVAYLWRMMQLVEHPNTELFELEGFNHGQMKEPAHPLLVRFVKAISAGK